MVDIGTGMRPRIGGVVAPAAAPADFAANPIAPLQSLTGLATPAAPVAPGTANPQWAAGESPYAGVRHIPPSVINYMAELTAPDQSPFGAPVAQQVVPAGGRGTVTNLGDLTGDAVDPTKNTITISNRGAEQGRFNLYQNEQPYVPGSDIYASIELAPGESKTVTLPAGWAGYMQKFNGERADSHTRVEFAFNQFQDLTFSNLSYEDGNNAAMLLRSGNGDRRVGTDEDLIGKARAEGLTSLDSTGREVIGFAEGQGDIPVQRIVDFYRRNLQPGQGYVQNFDNESSGGSPDKRLIVDVY